MFLSFQSRQRPEDSGQAPTQHRQLGAATATDKGRVEDADEENRRNGRSETDIIFMTATRKLLHTQLEKFCCPMGVSVGNQLS